MINSYILGAIIRTKLDMAEKAISLLPGEIRPMVREAGKSVLEAVHKELGLYLQEETREQKGNAGLRKVEVT